MACTCRHKRCDIFLLENSEYGLKDTTGYEFGDWEGIKIVKSFLCHGMWLIFNLWVMKSHHTHFQEKAVRVSRRMQGSSDERKFCVQERHSKGLFFF